MKQNDFDENLNELYFPTNLSMFFIPLSKIKKMVSVFVLLFVVVEIVFLGIPRVLVFDVSGHILIRIVVLEFCFHSIQKRLYLGCLVFFLVFINFQSTKKINSICFEFLESFCVVVFTIWIFSLGGCKWAIVHYTPQNSSLFLTVCD